jgi:hypothetical protein
MTKLKTYYCPVYANDFGIFVSVKTQKQAIFLFKMSDIEFKKYCSVTKSKQKILIGESEPFKVYQVLWKDVLCKNVSDYSNLNGGIDNYMEIYEISREMALEVSMKNLTVEEILKYKDKMSQDKQLVKMTKRKQQIQKDKQILNSQKVKIPEDIVFI